eukprot:3454609-Prorocentrum_lima.AAC.1
MLRPDELQALNYIISIQGRGHPRQREPESRAHLLLHHTTLLVPTHATGACAGEDAPSWQSGAGPPETERKREEPTSHYTTPRC